MRGKVKHNPCCITRSPTSTIMLVSGDESTMNPSLACVQRTSQNPVKRQFNFGEYPFRNCLENRDGPLTGVPRALERRQRGPDRPLLAAQEARLRGLRLFSKQFLH